MFLSTFSLCLCLLTFFTTKYLFVYILLWIYWASRCVKWYLSSNSESFQTLFSMNFSVPFSFFSSDTLVAIYVRVFNDVSHFFWDSVFVNFFPQFFGLCSLYWSIFKFPYSSACSNLWFISSSKFFYFSYWTLQLQNFYVYFSCNFCLCIDILYLIRHCQHTFLFFFKHNFLYFFKHIYNHCSKFFICSVQHLGRFTDNICCPLLPSCLSPFPIYLHISCWNFLLKTGHVR